MRGEMGSRRASRPPSASARLRHRCRSRLRSPLPVAPEPSVSCVVPRQVRKLGPGRISEKKRVPYLRSRGGCGTDRQYRRTCLTNGCPAAETTAGPWHQATKGDRHRCLAPKSKSPDSCQTDSVVALIGSLDKIGGRPRRRDRRRATRRSSLNQPLRALKLKPPPAHRRLPRDSSCPAPRGRRRKWFRRWSTGPSVSLWQCVRACRCPPTAPRVCHPQAAQSLW